MIQKQLSDTEELEEESAALSMQLTDTSTHQSGPVLFAKDTRGAAAAKCHSLKFTVILSGIQRTATSQPCDSEPWNQPCRCGTVHIKAALLMDDPQHPQPPTTSCNYVALLKCPC